MLRKLRILMNENNVHLGLHSSLKVTRKVHRIRELNLQDCPKRMKNFTKQFILISTKTINDILI